MAKAIPDRWINYNPVGKQIPDTRFIAFKVPLRNEVLSKVPEKKQLSTDGLLKRIPNLGLIIDLTNTRRYYDTDFFKRKGIEHVQINVPGHHVPTDKLINKFKATVYSFLNKNANNNKLIGVHCTHGVNRTGFMICHFMISESFVTPGDAVEKFGKARGYDIERANYIDALYKLWHEVEPTQRKPNECESMSEKNKNINSCRLSSPNPLHNIHLKSLTYDKETFKLGHPFRTADSDLMRKIYDVNFPLDPAGKNPEDWRDRRPPRDDQMNEPRGNKRYHSYRRVSFSNSTVNCPNARENSSGKQNYGTSRAAGDNGERRYVKSCYRERPYRRHNHDWRDERYRSSCLQRPDGTSNSLPTHSDQHSILLVKKWPENPYK